jgi:FixJ family two-component response regulator
MPCYQPAPSPVSSTGNSRVREGAVSAPSEERRPRGQNLQSLLTVGVVDDDSSVRRGLERLLRSAGFSVVTFASAEQFLALCPQEMLSCVILDVHLGGMSGLELLARLTGAHSTLPVILMTAHDDPQTNGALEQSGAAACMRKPFDDRVLIGAILDAVAGKR